MSKITFLFVTIKLKLIPHKIINYYLIYFQLLKGRHVMVRVGGGWDTFESYITKHDPCRTKVAGKYKK